MAYSETPTILGDVMSKIKTAYTNTKDIITFAALAYTCVLAIKGFKDIGVGVNEVINDWLDPETGK